MHAVGASTLPYAWWVPNQYLEQEINFLHYKFKLSSNYEDPVHQLDTVGDIKQAQSIPSKTDGCYTDMFST